MDDVLSNDDWDDSEADAASLLQARLQSRGVTSTSGNGIDSPLPLKEGMRLLRVQSPPVRILGLETAGVARNGNSGGVPRPDQNGGGSGELLDGRGEHLGPKRPASAPLLGTDFGAAQDGNGRTSNQVEIEIEIVPAEPEVAVKHGTSAKGSRFVPGKRASEAQPGQSRPIAKAAQEIELCTVEEPLRSPDAKEKAFAKQHGSRKTARAHQGVSHAAGNEREGPDGASGLHPRNPHHLDLESGLSGESQGESADGEREAEPMLANGAEANETWQFLPKKAMDLGRRFGEGEEVPWPHGREETPFSDQDAEFEVFRERGRRWTKSGEWFALTV